MCVLSTNTYFFLPPQTANDFTARQNFRVTFTGNQNTQTVDVFITDDPLYEEDEMFRGRLTLPSGSAGVMIGQGIATATIEDNDRKTFCSSCTC